MKTFIVFLRGINVSGQKKIQMADLRSLLYEAGFKGVKTYIQSGNIILQSNLTAQQIPISIQETIHLKYNFTVPVLVKTRNEIEEILDSNPLDKAKIEKSYYCLLFESPDPDCVNSLINFRLPEEEFFIRDGCIYLYYAHGAGKAKMSNNFIERRLKITATTRNHRTMEKLLTLSAEN